MLTRRAVRDDLAKDWGGEPAPTAGVALDAVAVEIGTEWATELQTLETVGAQAVHPRAKCVPDVVVAPTVLLAPTVLPAPTAAAPSTAPPIATATLLEKGTEAGADVVVGMTVKQHTHDRPQECIAVCIDRSGSMGSPFSEGRTRMEAVKQMFYAFRDRVESIGGTGHQLGLLQFDNEVETLLALSADLAAFEDSVDAMKKRGATAIFTAIEKGVEMLEPVAVAHPHTDLRVVVLTDGQNNHHPIDPLYTALDAFEKAHRVGVVVDAILVGSVVDQVCACPPGLSVRLISFSSFSRSVSVRPSGLSVCLTSVGSSSRTCARSSRRRAASAIRLETSRRALSCSSRSRSSLSARGAVAPIGLVMCPSRRAQARGSLPRSSWARSRKARVCHALSASRQRKWCR